MRDARYFEELRVIAGQRTKERDYWLDKLSGEPEKCGFPGDYKKEKGSRPAAVISQFTFSKEISPVLLKLSAGSDVRLHIIFASAVTLLLHTYIGRRDIIIGSPILKPGIDHDVDYTNTVIPLRNQIRKEQTFKELLLDMRQTYGEAVENQGYPIEILIDELGLLITEGDFPLFDVAVLLENIQDRKHLDPVSPKMIFSFFKAGEAVGCRLEYDSLLYNRYTVERITGHLERLFQAVLADVNIKIQAIDTLSEEEKRQLLVDFNDTAIAYPEGKTIQSLFADRVAINPHYTALVRAKDGNPPVPEAVSSVQEHISLTYRQLDEKAGSLADTLLQKGVGADVFVALMCERSEEMIIGIFAILKAGGAYLPIEPDSPDARKSYMLKESRAVLLLTTRSLSAEVERLRDLSIEIIYIEENIGQEAKDSQGGSGVGAAIVPPASNIAYVIYTSGSTGNPKGVPVRHSAVVNIISDLQNRYPLEETDTYLFKTSYVFDVSVAELFGWFPAGGRLALLEKEAEKEPEKIFAAVENFAVTHINFVPSMFNVFVDELNEGNIGRLAALKYIFLAGEALLPELVNKFGQFDTQIKLENIYGPTEGTVYTSYYSLSDWDGKGSIPIGKPMRNIKLYILSREDRLLPIGVPGELHIAGAGVAAGYLNNPELTAERFIQTSRCGVSSQILYKTGDLARRLPDGNIEYLGRIDFQVKIRGFRIEIGEIESRLRKHPDVKEAVVVDRQPAVGEKYLCAYIVPAGSDREISSAEMREFLSHSLPLYMIPGFFIQLDRIPLSSNGKLNRKALPEPGSDFLRPEVDFVAPRNRLEESIVRIWQEVLGIPRVGVNDRFFDIGGNSLNVIRVGAKMKQELGISMPLVNMFRYPTVSGLVAYLNREDRDETEIREEVDREDRVDEGKKRRLQKINKRRISIDG